MAEDAAPLVVGIAHQPHLVARHPRDVVVAGEPGVVLTRERLLAEVWGWPGASGTRTVDSHVKALRAKIGAGRVRTVHGVGYALEPGGAR